MIQKILALVLCTSLSAGAFGKGKKKTHINLPKVTDTLTNQISVHEDLNFYGEYPTALSSTTVDFGFLNNWDVAVGVYNVPIDSHIDNYDVSVLFNLERTFQISPTVSIVAGSSVGSDIVSASESSGIDIYSYIASVTKIWNIDLSAGGYYTNAWFGGYSALGFNVAVAVPINSQWSFQYEFSSGSNNLSGSTYQLFYKINKDTHLGFGIQPQYSNREQVISGIVSLYYH